MYSRSWSGSVACIVPKSGSSGPDWVIRVEFDYVHERSAYPREAAQEQTFNHFAFGPEPDLTKPGLRSAKPGIAVKGSRNYSMAASTYFSSILKATASWPIIAIEPGSDRHNEVVSRHYEYSLAAPAPSGDP